MNKTVYLAELANLLKSLPQQDREEILFDYSEHFRMGKEAGKTETEIAEALGDARTIAKQFLVNYTVQQAEAHMSVENVLRAVLSVVGLGFLNLIFVLGPFLGLLGVLMGLFAAAIGISVGGVATFLAIILSPAFPSLINISFSFAFAIPFSFGLTSLGLLFLIGDVYLARGFFRITLKYLKWNVEIVRRVHHD